MRGDLTRRLAIDDSPTSGDADSALMTPRSPSSEYTSFRIGPYKLLNMLGEGGFGCVYLAEQELPVRRKVALKILKLGMDTKQVIGRFEAERQALALMDHPNIAKVLDAGATESGRPYFVMELVKGVPITEYCDTHQLSTKERLVLFMLVCHAVQHAHQKGIIHRDIKPSNVMIAMHDGKPVPKVIDFGIAKALDQKLTDKTVFTEMRQLIGTPEYMSPEQAEMTGIDIDTRSDVYSLGVLLYELLTGSTPFDAKELRQAGYGEIQRIIREVEPQKPSTRLSTLGEKLTDVAKRRKEEPKLLTKSLRGDLDWIVMRCLEKDRTRRYETANGLAMDVLRYLCDEPVFATPPTFRYQFNKFIRRNRRLVFSLSAIAAVLLLSASISLFFALREANARVVAENAKQDAERDRDAALLAQADLTLVIAASRSDADKPAKQIQDCLDLYQRLGRQREPEAAFAWLNLAYFHFAHEQTIQAEQCLTNALNILQPIDPDQRNRLILPGLMIVSAVGEFGPELDEWTVSSLLGRVLDSLATNRETRGDVAGAADAFRLWIAESLKTPNVDYSIEDIYKRLGWLLDRNNRFEEAAQTFSELIAYREAGERKDQPGWKVWFHGWHGMTLLKLKRFDQAEKALLIAANESALDVNDPGADSQRRKVWEALCSVYEATGDSGEAARWKAKLGT
jgi:serine/threonine protein kinase